MEIVSKTTLLKLLDAIGYTDDKDVFVKEFVELVQIHAMDKLIISLPQDQQESLKAQLRENKDDLDKIGEILKSHFTEEQMKESFQITTQKAVRDWMQAVDPTLSEIQRQKLMNLSYELNFTSPSSSTE